MTNFKRFQSDVLYRVRSKLNDRGMKEISLWLDTINSPDGVTDRLMVSIPDSKMSMAFRLNDIFKNDLLRDGKDIDSIVESLCNTIAANLSVVKEKEDPVMDFITNYSQVKDSLYIRLIPGDSPVLKDTPHRMIGDMAAVVAFRLDSMSDAYGKSVVTVSTPLMEMYNVNKEQLFADAEKACTKNDPINFTSMEDMIKHLAEAANFPTPEEAGVTAYIVTNKSGFQGAGVLAYPDFFDKAEDKLGGSFWLIPSSVHEFILLKDSGKEKFEDLNSLIEDLNANVLDPRDILSEQCYHYDAIEKTLTTGRDYALGVTKNLMDFEDVSEDVDIDHDIDEGLDI